jgi:hypothetical protein
MTTKLRPISTHEQSSPDTQRDRKSGVAALPRFWKILAIQKATPYLFDEMNRIID